MASAETVTAVPAEIAKTAATPAQTIPASGVLELALIVARKLEHLAGELEDLLEPLGRRHEAALGAVDGDREFAALGDDGDEHRVLALGLGEEFGAVQAEVGQRREQLRAGIEAAAIEVVALDAKRRPDQQGEGALVELEERVDVDLGRLDRLLSGLGLLVGVLRLA